MLAKTPFYCSIVATVALIIWALADLATPAWYEHCGASATGYSARAPYDFDLGRHVLSPAVSPGCAAVPDNPARQALKMLGF